MTKQFTRQQLANYLVTGDTETQATSNIDASGYLSRVIDYGIQHNPTGAYNFIRRMFPGEFANWTKGTEFLAGSKDTMSRFLHNKTDQYAYAQKIAFAKSMLQGIPDNKAVDNWTNPIDR